MSKNFEDILIWHNRLSGISTYRLWVFVGKRNRPSVALHPFPANNVPFGQKCHLCPLTLRASYMQPWSKPQKHNFTLLHIPSRSTIVCKFLSDILPHPKELVKVNPPLVTICHQIMCIFLHRYKVSKVCVPLFWIIIMTPNQNHDLF